MEESKHAIDPYTAMALAKSRASQLVLNLLRFAEHNNKDLTKRLTYIKWTIGYDPKSQELFYIPSYFRGRNLFGIYFNDEAAVRDAIDAFHDELIWYFTEYEEMLKGGMT